MIYLHAHTCLLARVRCDISNHDICPVLAQKLVDGSRLQHETKRLLLQVKLASRSSCMQYKAGSWTKTSMRAHPAKMRKMRQWQPSPLLLSVCVQAMSATSGLMPAADSLSPSPASKSSKDSSQLPIRLFVQQYCSCPGQMLGQSIQRVWIRSLF